MRTAILLCVAVSFLGCAKGPNDGVPEMHPVSGQILYNGAPAAGIEVTLLPTDAPMVPRIPRNPHAVTSADGRFTINTGALGEGAAEGGYQVLLNWPGDTKTDEQEAKDTDRLLGWYDGTHSTINFRVKPGSNEIPTIKVPQRTQPPEFSPGVPGRN